MKTCYIVGAGDFFGDFHPSEGDLVIAADGGYDTLLKKGYDCHLFVGDMDSLELHPTGVEILRYPIEKDETDMFLAYYEGRRRGYNRFVVYGGVGGRIDHTFANFSLLIYGKEEGDEITLVADGYKIFAIKNEKISLRARKGAHLSVFAFSGKANGVSIIGAEYEVRDVSLSPEFPLGVSNSFTDNEVLIEVSDGVLLIMAGE